MAILAQANLIQDEPLELGLTSLRCRALKLLVQHTLQVTSAGELAARGLANIANGAAYGGSNKLLNILSAH